MLHTFTVTWSETDTRDPLVDEPLAPGEAREILFTVPTDVTSLHLYCVPHEDRMIGALTVVPAGDEPDGDQAPGEPSADPSSGTVPGGLMAWLAAALLLGAAGVFLLRRRQPADR